jgi:hypothetical protein
MNYGIIPWKKASNPTDVTVNSVAYCTRHDHPTKHQNRPWTDEAGRSRDMKTVKEKRLTTETVQGASLSLKCVDNVEGGDGLALGVLSVGDGVTDDTLKEGLQHTTGLLVDHWVRLAGEEGEQRERMRGLLAEIRLTPPRRARRRIAGLVIPWMLSRRILR